MLQPPPLLFRYQGERLGDLFVVLVVVVMDNPLSPAHSFRFHDHGSVDIFCTNTNRGAKTAYRRILWNAYVRVGCCCCRSATFSCHLKDFVLQSR